MVAIRQTPSPVTITRPAVRAMFMAMLVLLALCASASRLGAQLAIPDQGGPVMQTPTSVFLIFWLPTGSVYDTNSNLTPPGVGNYETLMQRFFTDLSQSNYFKILTQYPGTCGSNIPTQQSCFGSGTITVGGVFVDNQTPYPHAGTQQDPLQDPPDIQGEVQRIITSNNLNAGFNTEFFVFTGANIQECSFGSCTFPGQGLGAQFCAYHSAFTNANNQPTVYAFISDVSYINGCVPNLSEAPNGQISSDRVVVPVSHEFFESFSDPLLNSWVNPASTTESEIGDNCNWVVGGLMNDGSNISLNGNPYIVQEMWSNDDDGCVLSPSTIITAASIENNFSGFGVRSDTSTSNMLQTNTNSENLAVHVEGNVAWLTGTNHIRVSPFTVTTIPGLLQPWSPLVDESFSLTSHLAGSEDNDQWVLDSADTKIRNPNGSIVCEQVSNFDIGHPPTISDGIPFVFQTPNCQFNLFIMGPATEQVGDSQNYAAVFFTAGALPSTGPIQWIVTGPASFTASSSAWQHVTYTGPGTVTVQVDIGVAGSHIRATLSTKVVQPGAFSPRAAAMAHLIQSILSTQLVQTIINPLGPDNPLGVDRATAIQLLNTVQNFATASANAH